MSFNRILRTGLFLWLVLVPTAGVFAQSAGPQPAPMPPQISAPKDTPYSGTIRLAVDATDLQRHIFGVRETIPVRGGEALTLLYPQWLPGHHGPTGRVDKIAGLMIRAGGARVEWVRDPADVFAFHVDVPAGATSLDVEFQYLSPRSICSSRTTIATARCASTTTTGCATRAWSATPPPPHSWT